MFLLVAVISLWARRRIWIGTSNVRTFTVHARRTGLDAVIAAFAFLPFLNFAIPANSLLLNTLAIAASLADGTAQPWFTAFLPSVLGTVTTFSTRSGAIRAQIVTSSRSTTRILQNTCQPRAA